jgi:hypothetical protein
MDRLNRLALLAFCLTAMLVPGRLIARSSPTCARNMASLRGTPVSRPGCAKSTGAKFLESKHSIGEFRRNRLRGPRQRLRYQSSTDLEFPRQRVMIDQGIGVIAHGTDAMDHALQSITGVIAYGVRLSAYGISNRLA